MPVPPALIAARTARLMMEIEAVHFNADKPFVFTSGWASPVYVDCRKIISYPRTRRALMEMATEVILDAVGAESLDAVAGGETAGIPFAAWLADRLMLPMQYVRKKPKGFGRNAQIEGQLTEGARTLLVEDLASDGGSKLMFAEALRAAGARVDHCFVVFFYDIFRGSRETLAEAGLTLHYLATWWDMLEAARRSGRFDPGVLGEVERFLNAPAEWSAAHGGKSAPA